MKIKPELITWGDEKTLDVAAQNNMQSPGNPYAHITMPQNRNDGKSDVLDFSSERIIYRGNNNLGPQYDLELGKRSITHKRIAHEYALLVAGKGIRFKAKDKELDPENLPAQTLENLIEAQSWNKKGLDEGRFVMANGFVYFNHAACIVAQSKLKARNDGAYNKVLNINFKPSESFRFCFPKIDASGRLIYEKHAYQDYGWGFTGCEWDNVAPLVPLVSIENYISGSLDSGNAIPSVTDYTALPGYTVKNAFSEKSKRENFVSFSFVPGTSIFDNAYPLPEWKSESSINHIQCEAETSYIHIDYLKNGMHLYAIVNVYSSLFSGGEIVADDSGTDKTGAEIVWENQLDAIKKMKGSYKSGRILVNPVNTLDKEKDGTIDIKEVKIVFPKEAIQFFNEEARAAILTAWGFNADFFGITKPEKNNLRSQGEFMKISIAKIQEAVSRKQAAMKKSVDSMLEYYGLSDIECEIIPNDSNSFLLSVADMAAGYMTDDEARTMLFNLPPFTQEQKEQMKNKLSNMPPNTQKQTAQNGDVPGNNKDE